MTTTAVLDMIKTIVLTFISLAWSCHSNEMNLLPILLIAIVIDTGEFPFYQNRSRKVIPPIAAR